MGYWEGQARIEAAEWRARYSRPQRLVRQAGAALGALALFGAFTALFLGALMINGR